jgi:hypothetical protein
MMFTKPYKGDEIKVDEWVERVAHMRNEISVQSFCREASK